MRGREFIMKDAYLSTATMTGAKASYQVMAAAYRRIFDRFGLRYRAVAADSGCHWRRPEREFQVIAATGETPSSTAPKRLRRQHGKGRWPGANRAPQLRRP